MHLTFFYSNMWRIVTAGHVIKHPFYYVTRIFQLQNIIVLVIKLTARNLTDTEWNLCHLSSVK